jgi:hypothetical protein
VAKPKLGAISAVSFRAGDEGVDGGEVFWRERGEFDALALTDEQVAHHGARVDASRGAKLPAIG